MDKRLIKAQIKFPKYWHEEYVLKILLELHNDDLLKEFECANQAALSRKRHVLGRNGDLGPQCLGAVNGLGYERVDFTEGQQRSTLVCDPRYFAVMGLVLGHLNMEIVTHESVHAAFAYARRHRKDLWCDPGELEEEAVCYPAGIIAKRINAWLHDEGLYEQKGRP